MIRRFEQFSYYTSVLYRCIQQIERDEMVKYGLKGPYTQYLVAMERCPEGVTAARLCVICDKDKAAVSRTLAEMEARGLILKKTPNDTTYRAQLFLTEAGRTAAQYVCRKAEAAVKIAEEGLTEQELTTLYSALHKIASNLQALNEQGLE